MLLQELLSLASNTLWTNQKLSSRTSVFLLAACALQCISLNRCQLFDSKTCILHKRGASLQLPPKPRIVMLSLLKESYYVKRSLFYTLYTNAYLGFLPLSFHLSCLSIRALAAGKVCSCSLKSLHARQLLPRLCQR